MEGELSLRKYGELIGVSHTAVAKAVKAGYISKGWNPATKKIIVANANVEWGNEKKAESNAQVIPETTSDAAFSVPVNEAITIAEARPP